MNLKEIAPLLEIGTPVIIVDYDGKEIREGKKFTVTNLQSDFLQIKNSFGKTFELPLSEILSADLETDNRKHFERRGAINSSRWARLCCYYHFAKSGDEKDVCFWGRIKADNSNNYQANTLTSIVKPS